MIQRIQTVYLLLVAVIAVFLLWLNPSYARFEKSGKSNFTELRYVSTDFYENSETPTQVGKWINVLVIGGICLGSLISIFLFKKRELQKKLAIYMCLLGALLIIFMVMDYNTMSHQFPGNNNSPGLLGIFPVIMVVLSFMAWRNIRKDENLLKSMDRIR